jgi:hypothetical protein
MKFGEFWPRYLRAHSLPGTRAMHYAATVIGVTAALQAIVSRQPLFLIGIALGYAVAIGAHAYIERNAPLIRVNALWGAAADLRMSWLALTGGLGREIARVKSDNTPEAADPVASLELKTAAKFIRLPLLIISAIGLAAGLLDLGDLREEGSGLHYPFIQLGAPIAAFTAALGIGLWTISAARSSVPTEASRAPRSMSVVEVSLWRACTTLVLIGAAALAAAELAEHGLSESTQLYFALAAVIALMAALPIVLLGAEKAAAPVRRRSEPRRAITIGKWASTLGGAIQLVAGTAVLIGQAFGWDHDGSWAPTTLIISGTLFLLAGIFAWDRETKLNADRLFDRYLSQARGESPEPERGEAPASD